MKIYEPMCGEDILHTAKCVVNLASRSKKKVGFDFNGILLVAKPTGMKPTTLVRFYHNECSRRAEAYRKSPEGKKAAWEAEQRKAAAQKKVDDLMQQLTSLDFTNDVAVLDWLCEFQDPSDYIGVVKENDVILTTFAAHEYYPGVNCGKDFDGTDRNNFKCWLIGQALDGLQGGVGAIHPIIHKFAGEWKERFIVAA